MANSAKLSAKPPERLARQSSSKSMTRMVTESSAKRKERQLASPWELAAVAYVELARAKMVAKRAKAPQKRAKNQPLNSF
jgi:hypothetical protein